MPPIPSGAGQGHPQGRTTFDKLKMGALMGGSVGLIIGFIFGATNIIRYGPGPNGMMRTLGQYMTGSAATFGFFMSIGATIRTEAHRKAIKEYQGVSGGKPIILNGYLQGQRRRIQELQARRSR